MRNDIFKFFITNHNIQYINFYDDGDQAKEQLPVSYI